MIKFSTRLGVGQFFFFQNSGPGGCGLALEMLRVCVFPGASRPRQRGSKSLRVEKFCKRSAKKSTASPKFRQTLTETCNLAGARSRLDQGQILQQNTQRAAFGQIYPHPQLLHRPASKNFRNGRRRSRQLRRNFRKNFEIFWKFC